MRRNFRVDGGWASEELNEFLTRIAIASYSSQPCSGSVVSEKIKLQASSFKDDTWRVYSCSSERLVLLVTGLGRFTATTAPFSRSFLSLNQSTWQISIFLLEVPVMFLALRPPNMRVTSKAYTIPSVMLTFIHRAKYAPYFDISTPM